ncbi:MAG: hypothetical protein JNM76_06435 [Betaproteobacteria bacterium]|nr:hypothetical protein [Betaproteobacteria bacterium]
MKDFPIKLPTLWRQMFPAAMLGGLLAQALHWMQGQPFSTPGTLKTMAATAIMVLIVHHLQPTEAGERGLNVMNSWGFRRLLAWTDVQSVVFGRMYWVQPSLRLRDAQGRSYWIAIDTKDLAGLHELALAHGGPDHPLTRALETPLHRL